MVAARMTGIPSHARLHFEETPAQPTHKGARADLLNGLRRKNTAVQVTADKEYCLQMTSAKVTAYVVKMLIMLQIWLKSGSL